MGNNKDITLNNLLMGRTAVFGIAAIWILLFYLQPYLEAIPIVTALLSLVLKWGTDKVNTIIMRRN